MSQFVEEAERLVTVFKTVIWESLDPGEGDFVEHVTEVWPYPFRPMIDRGARAQGGEA